MEGEGGREGAPSCLRAGCTGAGPAQGEELAGRVSPSPEASPAEGCPGPPSTHRWVQGWLWSIHTPARPGRLRVPPMRRGAMPHRGGRQRWGALSCPGARGGWLRSG